MHPVRAALAGQLLQQVDGLAGDGVGAGEQHLELVDDRHDPGHRRVAGQVGELRDAVPLEDGRPPVQLPAQLPQHGQAVFRSLSMPTTRACGNQDGSRSVGTNSVKLTPSLKSSSQSWSWSGA